MFEIKDLFVIFVLHNGHFDSFDLFNTSPTQEEQNKWQHGVEHGNEKTLKLKVNNRYYQIGQESS